MPVKLTATIEGIEDRGAHMQVTLLLPREAFVLPNGKRKPKDQCLADLRKVLKGESI